MINPVIPFVTEKISLELNYTSSSLYNEPFINTEKYIIDKEVENFEKVIELIKKIRFETKNEVLQGFSLYIHSENEVNWIESNRELITSIFKFKEFTYNNTSSDSSPFVISGIKFSIILGTKTANKQKKKIEEQIIFYTKEIEYFKKKLTNSNFINKAPQKIVNAEKEKLNSAIKNLKLLQNK